MQQFDSTNGETQVMALITWIRLVIQWPYVQWNLSYLSSKVTSTFTVTHSAKEYNDNDSINITSFLRSLLPSFMSELNSEVPINSGILTI